MTHTTQTQQAIFASFVVDEQTLAQAQLEQHITQQGEVVAPEEFTLSKSAATTTKFTLVTN